jgi:lipopolysaccharide/colanic/teichoic acid biosynthesis glycosyltransferase
MVYPTYSYVDSLLGARRAIRRREALSSAAFNASWSCRVMDFVIALVAAVAFSPVFLLITILVKLQDGGPVLFRQQRIGQDGQRFSCLKFRSMRPDAEAYLAKLLATSPDLREQWEQDHKLKRDPRVTPIGAFLRKSSLDELPQLFNILAGDMSVVGPRPIVEAEIERYGRWYRYYCGVKPGLTGLWQVSGRNDVTYRRRIAMDRVFHRRQSFGLYGYIVLATAPAVVLRRGSY